MSILLSSVIAEKMGRETSSETYPCRTATVTSVSVSISELRAVVRKFAKSFDVERACPSAMFAGTETAALLI
jgi:hypothetical protein